MISDYATLYRDFLKNELLSIAEQLELKITGDTTSKVLVKRIMADIEEHGVPEKDECSDLMLEFLIAAEVCDENGDLIEDAKEKVAEAEPVVPDVEKMPECYGFEDDRDPACAQCKVMKMCSELRIKNRPACYGRYYAEHDENCAGCIEAPFCKFDMENKPNTKRGKLNG
jgi:hypothetical protein